MTNWEKQVNVSMDDIFNDNEDEIFAEEEKTEETVEEKIVRDEDDKIKEYLSDLNDFYSDNEQVDLASKGIKLTVSKEYYLDMKKKPIVRGKVTNVFVNWLKKEHPNDLKFIKKRKEKELLKEENVSGELTQKISGYNKTMQKRCLFLYLLMGEKMEFTSPPSIEEFEKLKDIKESLQHWTEEK